MVPAPSFYGRGSGWRRSNSGRMIRHEPEPEPMGPSMLLEKLPAHVLRDVFGFLGPGDVARAACACPAQGAAQRTVSQSIDATAAKALFLLLKFLRSPSLMLHADRARRPDTQVPSRRHGRGTRLEGDVSVLDEPRTELVLVDGAREGRR